MEDAEREKDRELLEQLKSLDVPEIPTIPGIIFDVASGWVMARQGRTDRSGVRSLMITRRTMAWMMGLEACEPRWQ